MIAYYNEIEPYAAQWLRNLIDAGHIAKGEVDERSVSDIRPSDLVGYTQHHFFAGIGGWSLALRLAGWDDSRPVWTGSCPCQPFSQAGKGEGFDDERHLWPDWFHLIRTLRPTVIFGEQVEKAVKHGWLDLVQDDLEGEGYSFGAVSLPAACVQAPHIRDRVWFVGESHRCRHDRQHSLLREEPRDQPETARSSEVNVVVNNNNTGSQGRDVLSYNARQRVPWTPSLVDWVACMDGKLRPIEPGTFPLAHGVPDRVGRLRAYGNAIVPQVAAEMIRAYMECRP